MLDCLNTATEAARSAGALIRAHLVDDHSIESKADFDFVTEIDRRSEELIRKMLAKKYPSHAFFCEEMVSADARNEDEILEHIPEGQYTWIVDALDGTTNYIRNMPQFCISIALAHGSELILGVVYDIMRDELFYAEKKQGAFCNGKAIHTSAIKTLENSIISFGFPAAAREKRSIVAGTLHSMWNTVGSLRILNCASLILCNVACGRTEGSFEFGIHLWDYAGAAVILREAGGRITGCTGSGLSIMNKDVCAGNPSIQPLLLEHILQAKGRSENGRTAPDAKTIQR